MTSFAATIVENGGEMITLTSELAFREEALWHHRECHDFSTGHLSAAVYEFFAIAPSADVKVDDECDGGEYEDVDADMCKTTTCGLLENMPIAKVIALMLKIGTCARQHNLGRGWKTVTTTVSGA